MKNIEKIFEFQKYEKNGHLQTIIDNSMSQYGEKISEEDLEYVAAAGYNGDRYKRRENSSEVMSEDCREL